MIDTHTHTPRWRCRSVDGVLVSVLVVAGTACDQRTADSGVQETRAAVSVSPGAPVRMVAPAYRRPTTDELVEKIFAAQQRYWANTNPSIVAEGVVIGSQVEAVQTGTTDRPCGLVTRYTLKVSQAWIKDPGDSVEFWTRGGAFPPGVQPPGNCPMGEGLSSEPRLQVGDHILVPLEVRDLVLGQAVNRPVGGDIATIKIVAGDAFGAAYAARWRAEHTRRFGRAIAKGQADGSVQP